MNYYQVLLVSFLFSFLLTPIMRLIAKRFNVLDYPSSPIKTHKMPTPYLGGVAIFVSFCLTLVLLRFTTSFPTGTLRTLRGILSGGFIIFILGLFDDIFPQFFGYKKKLLIQAFAFILPIVYGINIKFVQPYWFAIFLTILWGLLVTNAFNIIDVIDGLASSICVVAALAFFFIGLVGEEIYVNFAAVALAGACLGFLPFNLSNRYKIFMGDAGSLSIGFITAILSMGTSYTELNEIALLAPIFILGVPIFDTIFVSYHRIKGGGVPFLGSKDHFALRLEKFGLNRGHILMLSCGVSIGLSLIAFLITRIKLLPALFLIFVTFLIIGIFSLKLSKIRVE